MSATEENDAGKAGSTASLHQKLNPEGKGSSAEAPAASEETKADPYLTLSREQLTEKLLAADEKANLYWERLLRLQAETDNTLRRAERDVANAHKYALEKFANELLPIIDNLERSLDSATPAAEEVQSLVEGVSLTLKLFTQVLEKFGIEQVNPQNDAFNPELHQAVSVEANPSAKPGSVLKVLQKGYLLNNRLIRPALVVVAQA